MFYQKVINNLLTSTPLYIKESTHIKKGLLLEGQYIKEV